MQMVCIHTLWKMLKFGISRVFGEYPTVASQRYHCTAQLPTAILAQVLTVRNLVGEVVTR